MMLPSALRRTALALVARFERTEDGRTLPVQTAALPWRRDRAGETEILLITSRKSGTWIVPAGWPMLGRTLAAAAEIEACQEAGVRGAIADRPCGTFLRPKTHRLLGPLTFLVMVHPLAVKEEMATWPEQSRRIRQWFTRDKAADVVEPPELARLIRAFRT